MHDELTKLNALYARALAQAAALMHARRVGVLSDGAAAAMHAVEGSVMAETMAAMDMLNDLERLQPLADKPLCAVHSLHALVECIDKPVSIDHRFYALPVKESTG